MALTHAQRVILKADINGNPDLSSKPNTPDGAVAIADLYNLPASPTFTVWKTSVSTTKIGDAIDGTELAGLTQLNVVRLQCIVDLSADGVNPSLEDRRQFFDDIFSGAGGAQTRANLATLWKRPATRGEKLYATGTGSVASPGTLVVEGAISPIDVSEARAIP